MNLFDVYVDAINYASPLIGDGIKLNKFMNKYGINNPGIYNINGREIEYHNDADKVFIRYNDDYYYYNSDNAYYNNLRELDKILNT